MYSEAVIRKSLVFRPDTCISGHSPFEFLDPSHFAWQSRDAEVIRECALCSRQFVNVHSVLVLVMMFFVNARPDFLNQSIAHLQQCKVHDFVLC